MYIPAKTTLTYQAKVATDIYTGSLTELEQNLASAILTNDGFVVVDYQIAESGFFSANPDQLTMKVRTGNTDFASENDVQSIIDHFVYDEIGALPASTISDVQTPNAPAPVPTGTGQSAAAASDGNNPSSAHWYDSIVTWLEGAGTGSILGIGLAVVGLILLVGFLEAKKITA